MAFPVRITEEPDGRLCLESPYDASFVLGLKTVLPSSLRQWDPNRKRWLVSALAEAALLTFLNNNHCHVIDARQVKSLAHDPYASMPSDLKDAYEALHLAPNAPLLVAEASYKSLARVYHPDMKPHGNIATMEKLNDAIALIRHYLA